MKKKYLYNGQLMQHSDIEDAARQSNLDVDAYIQKAGIKAVEDNYSLNGKTFSAEDILDAANQSKLGFDDYIQKAGFEKKNQSLSVGTDGQLKRSNPIISQSESKSDYNALKDVPAFHVEQPEGNNNSIEIDKGQKNASDNTSVAKSPSTVDIENLGFQKAHAKKVEEQKQKVRNEAVDNTVNRSLKLKGINAQKGSLLYNIEKSTYDKQLEEGNATVGVDKNGKPGLAKTTGFLDSFHSHMMAAINENKDSREFKDMTPSQRVDFVKKLEQEQNKNEYIGEKPTPLGSLGAAGGGAVPPLGLYGAGALAGGLLESFAPETGGLSHLAMKPVMSFVTNAGSEANKSGMQGVLSRYFLIKQHNPNISDEEAMTKAGNGEDVDRMAGIAQAGLFSQTGNILGKSVTKSFIKDALKTGVDVGGKVALVEGAKDLSHNDEGVSNKSGSDIIKDMGVAFAENAPMGAALHGFMGALTGISKVPNLIKSALKYDVVTKMKPEEVQAELNKNVQSGAITPEEAQKAETHLNDFSKTLQTVSPYLSDEAKASITGLIEKRKGIEKEAETKDATEQPVYKKLTDAINLQISDIQRTGKPLEHEIDITGETYKKPTFDNIAAMRVKNAADKISKGKELTDAEEIQAEHNFPDKVEAQLNKVLREEKSANKDKEKPNTEITDNIEKYLNDKSKETEKTEVPIPTEKASITDEGTNKNIQRTEITERTPEEIKKITKEPIEVENMEKKVDIMDIESFKSGAKEVPLKRVKAFEARTELRQRLKDIESIIKCL